MFANIVVGDEINRASPKTQSALLECMEERQVTVDGTTYQLEPPFMVVATQNPIEMEGTYPLPEAQRDRFIARISMGYPTATAELEMLDIHGRPRPLDQLEPVADRHRRARADRGGARRARRRTGQAVRRRAGRPRRATAPELRLGASPRADAAPAARRAGRAALDGRDYVIPDDVQALAVPVLAHRLLPTAEALVARKLPEQVVARLVEQAPLPPALTEGGIDARLLRALTTRGRSFVAAGAAAIACGTLVPEPDLLRIGVVLLRCRCCPRSAPGGPATGCRACAPRRRPGRPPGRQRC